VANRDFSLYITILKGASMKIFNENLKTRFSLWLIETVLGIAGWFMELNFMKSVAIFTLACFLISSVAGQAIAAVVDSQRSAKEFKKIF